MDKFVIRTPRQQIEKKLSKPVEPKKKQTKIETLSVSMKKRVFNKERIIKNTFHGHSYYFNFSIIFRP